MRPIARSRLAGLLALGLAAAVAGPSAASAGALGQVRATAETESAVVHIGNRWDDDRRYWRHHRRSKSRTYVRAPFTRVETRGHRATSVDAPFASVRVRRHGVWVRAPFVDLYVPRYRRGY